MRFTFLNYRYLQVVKPEGTIPLKNAYVRRLLMNTKHRTIADEDGVGTADESFL